MKGCLYFVTSRTLNPYLSLFQYFPWYKINRVLAYPTHYPRAVIKFYGALCNILQISWVPLCCWILCMFLSTKFSYNEMRICPFFSPSAYTGKGSFSDLENNPFTTDPIIPGLLALVTTSPVRILNVVAQKSQESLGSPLVSSVPSLTFAFVKGIWQHGQEDEKLYVLPFVFRTKNFMWDQPTFLGSYINSVINGTHLQQHH